MSKYLNNQELMGRSFMVAAIVNDVPINQVRPILDRAEDVLLAINNNHHLSGDSDETEKTKTCQRANKG